MLTLVTLSSLNDAQLLRSLLEAGKIPAFIPDENTCQADWGYINAIGGVRVQIPEEFAKEAASILKDFQANFSCGDAAAIDNQWAAAETPAPVVTSNAPVSPEDLRQTDAGWEPLIPVFVSSRSSAW